MKLSMTLRRGGSHTTMLKTLTGTLTEQLPPLDRAIRTAAVEALAKRILAHTGYSPPTRAGIVAELVTAAASAFGAASALEDAGARLTVAYQDAATEQGRRQVMAAHLQATVPARQLRRDLRALSRHLDLEALQERQAIRIASQLDQVQVAYRCAEGICATLTPGAERFAAFGGGSVLQSAFQHAAEGKREVVRTGALRLITALLAGLPEPERLRSLGANRYRAVCDWARDPAVPRWTRVAALTLVATAQPRRGTEILAEVLADRETPDTMVERRNALRLIGDSTREPVSRRLPILLSARDDPSEHVRQQLAWTLASIDDPDALQQLQRLCAEDDSPRVRGVAAQALVTVALARPHEVATVEQSLDDLLTEPAHALDSRVALQSVRRLCLGAQAPCAAQRFVPSLEALCKKDGVDPYIMEDAAALLRELEVQSAPALTELSARFASVLAGLPEGRGHRLTVPDTLRLRDVELALAIAARGDLSVSLRHIGGARYRLQRGEPRTFKLWRLLHELRNPAPDKRKAFPHSHGRTTGRGSVIPTHLLAEVTPTRVPGERRLCPQVGGWGPFLPRVDDLLEAARPFRTPVRVVTSLGVLSVVGPRGLLARLLAWLRVTLRYAQLDDQRTRSLQASTPSQQKVFAESCRKLGFSFSLGDSHGDVAGARYDLQLPRIATYLSSVIWPALRAHWDGLLQYTVNPTAGVPWHLASLVWLVLSAFIIRAAWIMGRIERARRSIPITVGGWGTRGKSGTERLKAALFHAMRYDVVVKTTGCEAMFIHARRDLPAREIFLYRPYDKATIWEQRKVLEFGERLGAQVFLWECMALNPRFVQVLNHYWMQDPVTTLTNAYPDHEDVMGPAGEDVARVIGLFMPKGGTTYTAEEQMLPILRELARQRGTQLVPVTPLEADLLPLDLLQRYPYEEHPRNIALVLALANHWDVDREFGIVEMGDRVVPDLGVLKTYPEVTYRRRSVRFSNGMSANERAGFLSNWTRLGFDQMDIDRDPTLWSVAVVNNRADRVPRSRVFAEILMRDATVDAIVLIGTNLDGMQSFMAEALGRELAEIRFAADGLEQGMTVLEEWIGKIGMPRARETLYAQVLGMLSAYLEPSQAEALLGSDELAAALEARADDAAARIAAALRAESDVEGAADEIEHHLRTAITRARDVDALRGKVRAQLGGGDAEGAATTARAGLQKLALSRIHILWDAGAKGDQVVDFMTGCIPPGFSARLLGCQNIKGTGLDFVYRWLSLGAVTDTLARIERDVDSRGELLASLTTYKDFGILDCELALNRVRGYREHAEREWQAHATILQAVEESLAELHEKKRKSLSATTRKSRLERFLDTSVEPLLDHWDSTRRTKGSLAVMNDLFEVRVGQGRAALLLRDLVARQKGGWLSRAVKRGK